MNMPIKETIRIRTDNADGANVRAGQIFTAVIDGVGTAICDGLNSWHISPVHYDIIYDDMKTEPGKECFGRTYDPKSDKPVFLEEAKKAAAEKEYQEMLAKQKATEAKQSKVDEDFFNGMLQGLASVLGVKEINMNVVFK